MGRRFASSSLLALAFVFFLAAPLSAAPRQHLNVGAFAQDIGTLDPHMATGGQDKIAVSWMFNGLARFKPGSVDPVDIEPDLAESWSANTDKTVWTFRLRRGVQFHQGFGEVTAEDVVFSLNRASNPKTSAYSSDYVAFDRVEAVDPYTVRIVLKSAVPSLLSLVLNYSGGFVVSKKAVEQFGDKFGRNPVGTGPFAFDKLVSNQSLELKAHDGYYRGKPRLQTVSYKFIAAAATRDLAFQSGELDLMPGQSDQKWVDRIKQVPNSRVDRLEPGWLDQLSLNITQKPLDDIRVRQAIAHAVNRDELIRWAGADVSREAQSVIPRGYLGFTADNGLQKFDLAKAKQLLADAGYPNGVTIKMIHTSIAEMLPPMQVAQAQLRRAGITIDMQVVDHPTFHSMIRQDLSPIVFYEASRFPVADSYLTQFFHSQSIVKTPKAVTNFSHCAVADSEIDAARTEPDEAKQVTLWATAQRKVIAEVCAVPLLERLFVWARRSNFDFGYDIKGAMAPGPIINETSRFTE